MAEQPITVVEQQGGVRVVHDPESSPKEASSSEGLNSCNPTEEDAIQEISNADGQVVETSTMLATVKNHLEKVNWKYDLEHADGEHVIIKKEGSCVGENGSYGVSLVVQEPSNIFCVFVKSHITFPRATLEDLSVFLTRANFGILAGNFELDMSDGEVRYTNVVNVSGSFLSEEMIHAMIGVSLVAMDKYFAAAVKVAYGALSPEAAIHEIESNEDDFIPLGQ